MGSRESLDEARYFCPITGVNRGICGHCKELRELNLRQVSTNISREGQGVKVETILEPAGPRRLPSDNVLSDQITDRSRIGTYRHPRKGMAGFITVAGQIARYNYLQLQILLGHLVFQLRMKKAWKSYGGMSTKDRHIEKVPRDIRLPNGAAEVYQNLVEREQNVDVLSTIPEQKAPYVQRKVDTDAFYAALIRYLEPDIQK